MTIQKVNHQKTTTLPYSIHNKQNITSSQSAHAPLTTRIHDHSHFLWPAASHRPLFWQPSHAHRVWWKTRQRTWHRSLGEASVGSIGGAKCGSFFQRATEPGAAGSHRESVLYLLLLPFTTLPHDLRKPDADARHSTQSPKRTQTKTAVGKSSSYRGGSLLWCYYVGGDVRNVNTGKNWRNLIYYAAQIGMDERETRTAPV